MAPPKHLIDWREEGVNARCEELLSNVHAKALKTDNVDDPDDWCVVDKSAKDDNADNSAKDDNESGGWSLFWAMSDSLAAFRLF